MKLLAFMAILTTVVCVSEARAEPQTLSGLCEARWEADYIMREDCEKKQMDALSDLIGYDSRFEKFDEIIGKPCKEKWLPDFVMAIDCYQKQELAAKIFNTRLNIYQVDDPELSILLDCAGRWPDDFQMRNYCFTEQNEARLRLVE